MAYSDPLLYLTNALGHPEAVVIPLADWQHLRCHYEKLKRRQAMLSGIGAALLEIPEIVAGRQPEVELEEFLDSL